MKDRRMPFPTTYPLFQLVRLMSIREDGDSGKSPVVTKYAWIEAGEDNLLALYNSNGKYILTQFFCDLTQCLIMNFDYEIRAFEFMSLYSALNMHKLCISK